jgi:type VI secretion system protein ImpG
MREDLLLYYERELAFLRQSAQGFAQRYPKIASRLVLEPDKCEDPHVERLLEAFAFLAARVHLKIDDDFPEITEAILSIVYPHFIRPLPSMSIVEFELDPEKGKLSSGLLIPAGSTLYSRAVQGVPCKFRTSYPLTLYPIQLDRADWTSPDRLRPPIKAPDSHYAIPLRFSCPPDVETGKLGLDRLRFYLNGESSYIHLLYEVLNTRLTRILVRNPLDPRQPAMELPASALRPVGFETDEAMLDYPGRSFLGYRLLQEFFAFPEKFFFLEIDGLAPLLAQGFSNEFEIILLISKIDQEDSRAKLESFTNASVFRHACVPVINLFPQTCEPIILDQKKAEYPILPDVRRMNALEIYSIEQVLSIDHDQQTTKSYEPFYSIRHVGEGQKQNTFYISNRRPSMRENDEGSDLFLSLVDLSFRPVHPSVSSVTVKTYCTNRDLPSRLPFGQDAGDFELEASAPLKRIIALRKPTPTLRTDVEKKIYWHLISHLSLNYLSLVEDGVDALRQILSLYDYSSNPYSERMIAGITSISSARKFARLVSEEGVAFARGSQVTIEFDEEQFVGGGVYLFAAVLERFLASYASLNSFSQLTARSQQRKEPIRQWPPRAGQKILI